MNSYLRDTANTCMEILRSLPMVKSCALYGSIANNTEDELSDIDIQVDVFGYDNGKFMLEVPYLINKKLNIVYYDFAPSLIPNIYIVSNAISVDNPFALVDIMCVADPHCTTVLKDHAVNDIFTHTLKIWVINLKHHVRGYECHDAISRMAKRLGIKDTYSKSKKELLEEALIWIEENQSDKFGYYVNSCRKKFEELLI
jgi:Predicted nucleotidyltransferases